MGFPEIVKNSKFLEFMTSFSLILIFSPQLDFQQTFFGVDCFQKTLNNQF